MGGKTRQRQYTTEERAEVLRLCGEIGAHKAAAKLGIPIGTATYWWWAHRKKPKAQAVSSSPTRAASAPPAMEETSPDESKAESSRKVARAYTPSQKARALEYVAQHGVTAGEEIGPAVLFDPVRDGVEPAFGPSRH
jgi:transposase-like protein